MTELSNYIVKVRKERLFPDKNLGFAKVNSVENANLIRKLNIKNFPALYLFMKGGEIKEKYRGFWNIENFKTWLTKNL